MYRIGIDIGGMSIKAGLVTKEKKIRYKVVKVTKKGDETAFIQGLVELIEEILAEAKLTHQEVEYVGIGSPGLIDSERGVIVSAGNLGLKNFPLKERLERILPLQVLVNNDANCAALGEYHFLENADVDSFVMLTLGTGIGGGIILNHKIYEGFDGSAGDNEENLKDTAEIVKIAHSFGASVEGEIGHVGQADTGDNEETDMYTTRQVNLQES